MKRKHTKTENVKIQATDAEFVIWFENGDRSAAVNEAEAWERIEEEKEEPEWSGFLFYIVLKKVLDFCAALW